MANTLGITEVTLKEAADITHAVNVYPQMDSFHKRVIRITDHADNDALEVGDNTDKMALFECAAKGHPWMKKANVLNYVVWKTVTPATDAIPTNVALLIPNWDYTEFQ